MWVNGLLERRLGWLALLGAFLFFLLATVAFCHCAPPPLPPAPPDTASLCACRAACAGFYEWTLTTVGVTPGGTCRCVGRP